jgi:predicted secreted Zn-dependent protease
MRKMPAAIMGLAALCALAAGPAAADVKLRTAVKAYGVRGATGGDLVDQMNRYGPRHGLLTRAIAQTKYTVSWDITWRKSATQCRVQSADAVLSIDYTYPKLEGRVSPGLERRWTRFMQGVRRHEQTHGRIAVRMVNEAQKAAMGVVGPADAGCRTANGEIKRRVNAIYARYEAEQLGFDTREHRDRGPVEKLVEALAKP